MGDNVFGVILAILIALPLYFLPTIFAFRRKHAYKNIIAVINLIFGLTGLGWAGAMIWAIWPTEKTFIDPLVGNPTGTGERNTGNVYGEALAGGVQSFFSDEKISKDLKKITGGVKDIFSSKNIPKELQKLAEIHKSGVINDEEFEALKRKLINGVGN
jgi:hypothetical protein